MDKSQLFVSFILCFLIVDLGSAELVNFNTCPGIVNECTIQELNITPCKEALKNKPCRMKKGTKGSITLEMTPKFSSDTLYSQAFWDSVSEVPFAGMDIDGCNYATCPLVKDQPITYKFDLQLAKKFPSGNYNIKWKMGEKKDGPVKCCFMMAVRLY